MVIAKYLLHRFSGEFGGMVKGFSPNAAIAIREFGWPGNIRQLRPHREGVVLADKAMLGPDDLRAHRRRAAGDPAAGRGQGEVPARVHQSSARAQLGEPHRDHRAISASTRAPFSAISRKRTARVKAGPGASARGMKLSRPIARIVAKAALVVSVAALPACIVPPLEPEQQTTQFPPPLLVSDPKRNPTNPTVEPLPLLITGYRRSQHRRRGRERNLPSLYARLFFAAEDGAEHVLAQHHLHQQLRSAAGQAGGHALPLSGKYPQERLCGYPNGTLIWLFVADFPFSDSDPTQPVKPGQMDSNFWELECS